MFFPDKNSLIDIGKIVKPFGINGHVIINSNFFANIDFKKSNVIFAYWDYCYVPLVIEEYEERSDDFYLVKFQLIDNINVAEKLSNTKIFAIKKHIILNDLSFYDSPEQLMNFDVIDLHWGRIGNVVGILKSTATQLEVARNDKTIFIQLIPEYIHNIDWKRKIVFVNLPEQLSEFYELK
jgi:16S rRNA processing protein RimM